MVASGRELRAQRRQEADQFRRFFQPLAYFFGAIGLLLLAWTGLSMADGQPLRRDLAGGGVLLVAFPIGILLFRLARGHFRRDVRH